MAVPFDSRRLAATGPAIALTESVAVDVVGAAEFALSETGTLAYMPLTPRLSEVVRVDRSGDAQEIDPGWRASFGSLALSPNGRLLALAIGTAPSGFQGNSAPQDIWIKRLDRGPLTRLTFEGTSNRRPSWSDDQFLTFVSEREGSTRTGGSNIWMARADGTDKARLLMDHELSVHGAIWSPGGAWLLSQVGGSGERDIFAWNAGTDSLPRSLIATPFDEFSPVLSPDGRWLAYVSDETGRSEIHVRPFPAVDTGHWQVSTNGGNSPLWAHSGRELFYRSAASEMIAVQVGGGAAFVPEQTRALFSTAGYYLGGVVPDYAVEPDDQSFIMFRTVSAQTRPDLTVVLNFFEDLRVRGGN
jgi:dipeptidyl aminopeptidase/acylaminoacyl peptidase